MKFVSRKKAAKKQLYEAEDEEACVIAISDSELVKEERIF